MTVYLHVTADVLDFVPPLLARFPLRALLAATADDHVILPDASWPEELALLDALGFGPRPEHVVCAPAEELSRHNGLALGGMATHFMSGASQIARAIAVRQELVVHAPDHDVCLRANRKSWFQDWINRLGWRPQGTVVERDRVSEAVVSMLDRCDRVLVKGDHAASGFEQAVVGRNDPIPDCASFSRESGLVVVQEWILHERTTSIHCEIAKGGNILLRGITDQVVDGTHHLGNRFPTAPMDSNTRTQMEQRASLLASLAARDGYWGPFGVDFIITPEGDAWPTEVNARVVAPWYPAAASRHRWGVTMPYHLQGFRFPPHTRFDEIEEHLRTVLLRPKQAMGFVPFCFVPEDGFCYGVTYAPSAEDLTRILPAINERLAALAPSSH